jgi:type 1 glutamine amidotransferase
VKGIFALKILQKLLLFLVAAISLQAADAVKPMKVLLLTSGGYHDYKKLGPFLTNELSKLVPGNFEWKDGVDILKEKDFANGYDAIIYDVCDDEAPDGTIENAMRVTREGKPTVLIHCAVHAFRKTLQLSNWEAFCGMRSKVHDPFQSFTVTKVDEKSTIVKGFPEQWTTPGDELYQMISIDPKSRVLLKAKSPKDGREHVVCWTSQQGKGRVFATTLGHDMKTTATPEYLQLVANGLKWACHQLEPEGK